MESLPSLSLSNASSLSYREINSPLSHSSEVNWIQSYSSPDLVVGEVLFGPGANEFAVNVYVNPGQVLGTPDATYTGPFQGGQWDQVRISAGSTALTQGTFDKILIGTRPNDVLPKVAVPTMSAWGLGLLAGILGLLGIARRKKSVHTRF